MAGNRIFQKGNYIIVEVDDGGTITKYPFTKKACYYTERNEFYDMFGGNSFSIDKATIGTFLDAEAGGVFYTEATLLTFLRTYSGATASGVIPTKSGIVLNAAFAGNPKKAIVTFITPFNSDNYSVSIVSNTILNQNYAPVIEAITAAGFTIMMGANNINSLIDVRYIAILNAEN